MQYKSEYFQLNCVPGAAAPAPSGSCCAGASEGTRGCGTTCAAAGGGMNISFLIDFRFKLKEYFHLQYKTRGMSSKTKLCDV